MVGKRSGSRHQPADQARVQADVLCDCSQGPHRTIARHTGGELAQGFEDESLAKVVHSADWKPAPEGRQKRRFSPHTGRRPQQVDPEFQHLYRLCGKS